jgi:hypothetical protein
MAEGTPTPFESAIRRPGETPEEYGDRVKAYKPGTSTPGNVIRETLDRLEGTIAEDTDSGSAEAVAFAQKEVAPARAALQELEDALRFYADPMVSWEALREDNGATARRALGIAEADDG